MATFFISDLHLGTGKTEIQLRAIEFLSQEAPYGDALYILGDLFDYWIGDDAPTAEGLAIITALRRLADVGVTLHFLSGNRDFLVGQVFSQASGCQILSDPAIIDLYGVPTLLMHGDTLCTDDVAYQRARARLRRPAILRTYLALPKSWRRAVAQRLRRQSQAHVQHQPLTIMDVNQTAVETALRIHGVKQLIHGHTHRPAVHHFTVDGHPRQRIVLGDWDRGKSALSCTPEGFHFSDSRILEPRFGNLQG
ncbi:UDP-2,3-diacylglucosamine hydrolase [Nitrosococcus oceani ATCC 19707]|uniref:UDP-2,3-diacylglucosamine hydrolase n=2 Tax=Nitrosococcus oceani TaxID=1229 RepID=LPXH_NITOC|nr:UDP-2,3-diacylglucosamine diphosphatase [Nitrosococcus oceani]Q3J8Y6.1 RecName: Full=UDP-2,3-diacylglucosamine hydrolase; AltName: Full=UDP-2,3-diacylglucosamine diphosphatase [Nitrosococcus oceani ATCC 19707]KFI18788.1 UDP-2,3-diacylglucosamine hydrolase [Nitrosococcus oceani C-27]ABA58710.1 UDP-2,3-diacylglucosamine hydrolase [Nitrosococcus oceani ATCC 19707]EDZ67313.1 UDP-2,3-diacylglucosamine hydrolase [Nitrosococcus oceani AFC27]GEM19198.1 UDP-2,3-diacylglucosamine hydrolase [Nitrosoco